MPAADIRSGGSDAWAPTIGPAIMRIAGWPIETVEPLRSAHLAARVDAWIREDDEIRRDSEALARHIHDAVPQIMDRKARRIALEIKRRAHAATDPLPEILLDGLLKDEHARERLACVLAAAARRRSEHAAERGKIEQAHAAEIERARGELDRIAGEARFLCTLCLASPSTFRQWQAARREPTDRRKRERLHSTLHRYLMRAVGRATPNSLWAGIALESMDRDASAPLTVAPAAPLTRVSPALAVFARALQAMTIRRPWNESVPMRLNPTLRRADSGWEFGTFVDGFWCLRRVADHPAVASMASRLSTAESACLGEIESALCHDVPDLAPTVARQIVDALVEGGILWPAAAMPAIYADTWQALDGIITTLPPSEAPLWRQCRAALARIAGDIEASIDLLDPEALRRRLDDAREAANAVFSRYGSSVLPAEDVLVLDRTAPFRFAISRALASTLEDRVRTYWRFDRFGLGKIETQAGMRRLFGACDRGPLRLHEFLPGADSEGHGPGTQSWEDRVFAKAAGDLVVRARDAFVRWEQEIEPAFAHPLHRLQAADMSDTDAVLPPGSALFLIGSSGSDLVVRLGGVTPEPCFFYARFSYLFGADERAPDAFLAWHRAGIRAIESRWPQLQFCDLAIRNHRSPNVTARPRTSSRLIDPLDDGATLRDATLAWNRSRYPVLSVAGETRRLIPSARSAAYLTGLDRFASVLASVAVFLGRPALLAPMPRFSREIATWRHLPRLVLGDTAISPERWTPPDIARSLAKAQGAERFVLWRRFVREARLPDFVHAFHGRHQTESLLTADSALAIECLAQDLKAQGPSLRLQEVFPPPDQFIVRDATGQRYLAELAVSWHGDADFWRRYAEDGVSRGG